MGNEPKDMMDAVSRSMAERTGRSVEEWVALVRADGPDPLDQKAVRGWLRDVHGLPQNSQWTVAFAAAQSAGWRQPEVDETVTQMYAGKKAPLRPLHDAVVALAASMGEDTDVQARSTYTPVVRRTQFLAVAPGPRGTVRVGLRYRAEVPDDERLSPAKGFAQATHWLHLPGDLPPEQVRSLDTLVRAAYEQG